MRRRPAPGAAAVRARPLVWAVLVWCLLPAGLVRGQAAHPALAHLVRPAPGTRPLGDVLAELSRQGQLPFSYSSSLVPLAHRCTLRPGPARPLGVVLREVLAAEHLSYGLLGGQLVLWPGRVAAPAGVAAVNGWLAPAVQPSPLPPPPLAAPAAGGAVAAAKTAALGGSPAGRLAPLLGRGAPMPSAPAKQARTAAANARLVAKRPLRSGTVVFPPLTQSGTSPPLSVRSKPETLYRRPLSTSKRLVTNKLSNKTLVTRPRRSRARFAGYSQATTPGAASAVSPYAYATRNAGPPPKRPVPVRGPVPLLPPLLVAPPAALAADGAPRFVRVPTGLDSVGRPSPLAGPAQSGDAADQKPFTLASLGHPGYLHGEAWLSESLPLNAAVKLGIPRIYLVLGVAAKPFDHQSAGAAGGVGLGTTGQPRGRFTPSLDLVQWFLAGEREAPKSQLTQLRPLLAWQLKQGGRWQLVGGPTLNLATARRDGPRTRWALGQDQWLWLNADREQSLLRLWPGLQLGLRF